MLRSSLVESLMIETRPTQPADVVDGQILVDEPTQPGFDRCSDRRSPRGSASMFQQLVIDLHQPLRHEDEYIYDGQEDTSRPPKLSRSAVTDA